MKSKKLQIGVMGSAADIKYSNRIEQLAFALGKCIARGGNITVYGAEKDVDSLSTAAARGAKSAGGITVGITYGIGRNIWDKDEVTDIVIVTGLARGGGREFVLVNSCDAIIIVSGGSGTLSEATIAYQCNIPVVALKKTGGWADKLADTYLDSRKRFKIIGATTPEQAVGIATGLAKKKVNGK